MRAIAIALLLTLTACADAWMTPAQKAARQATQEVIAERVASGRMTPAEGRMILAQQYSQMEEQSQQMMAVYMLGTSTYQRVGPGTVIKY